MDNELSVEETKVIKPILLFELERAIEQLNSLQKEFNTATVKLRTPDKYTLYQRLFISNVMTTLQDSCGVLREAREAKNETNKQTAH